jgi:MFS family permease
MRSLQQRSAVRFVVLLGCVSLFADMTYEGGRSITGPFLSHLGASATAVGILVGLGELLGYGLRVASGYLSDRTGRYWAITLAGYLINLLAVPALALAGRWELAAVLVVLERTGKAIRTPARNAMLAHATAATGRGWGFGLHEAMDQTGAMIGPLLVGFALHRTTGHYPSAFALLLVPALCSILVLLTARHFYPDPSHLEVRVPAPVAAAQPSEFWWYLAASGLIAAGFADFPVIAYHLAHASILPADRIPLLYAAGMGAAAVAALVAGRLLDRFGLIVIGVSVFATAGFAPLVFLGGGGLALLGMLLWGLGMGVMESTARAALANMVPSERRAGAYGLFDGAYGVTWFLGSALIGFLYDRSVNAAVLFSVGAQLAAVPLLLLVARRLARQSTKDLEPRL